jgi:hypothetical protein
MSTKATSRSVVSHLIPRVSAPVFWHRPTRLCHEKLMLPFFDFVLNTLDSTSALVIETRFEENASDRLALHGVR